MKRTKVAEELIEGLGAFVATLEAGDDPTLRFRTHTVRLPANSPTYTPEQVQAVRDELGATEADFARFLGVSVRTVRGWEQGRAAPPATAARFLDEMRQKPAHFRARIRQLAAG
jgi:putative transcriptional regulator